MTTEQLSPRGPTGLRGLMWIAVWGFSGFFLNYSTMVPIGLERGLDAVTAGTLLTIMMLSVIAVQPAAPALRQRWGPRRTIGSALVLMAAGHGASLAIGHPVAALLVTGLAVGCGFGVLVVVATAAVPLVSRPDRAGRALGQFGAATSSAAAVGAPLGLWLSGAVPLEAFRLVAAACVLLAFVTLRGVPDRVAEVPGVDVEPGQAGAARASGPGVIPAPTRWWAALGPVLLPFLVSMAAYGLVIAFGPGGDTAHPAVFIATMQAASVAGRWGSGSLTDRLDHTVVYTAGIAMTAAGLVAVALAEPPWLMAACLVLMGVGIGTVQSASLVMAFARGGSHGRASVGWNMSFDTGLGLAGVFGGVGFTYLGPGVTFAGVAGLILLAGVPLWLSRAR
ncbi:MFS transporter [Citricoccus sp. I39-566]|uniref:MFS transporter n=1 Tax=Citricoccus sp. I39-566 TaxID=3073268 RepID=UPI00286BD641|nr:MFS transporter [Citricoccus sp. I39-566]WMY79278.1 MFS transporter [Citricoccus sp. I39-566]